MNKYEIKSRLRGKLSLYSKSKMIGEIVPFLRKSKMFFNGKEMFVFSPKNSFFKSKYKVFNKKGEEMCTLFFKTGSCLIYLNGNEFKINWKYKISTGKIIYSSNEFFVCSKVKNVNSIVFYRRDLLSVSLSLFIIKISKTDD